MPRLRRPPFTEQELIVMDRLQKESGLRISVIAERFGVSYGSCAQALHRFRRGQVKASFEEYEKKRDRIIHLFSIGVTVRELANMTGHSVQVIDRLLTREGLDAEMRRQVRHQLQEEGIAA